MLPFWVDECSFPVRWEFCDRSLEGILMISVACLLNFWKHKRMLFRGKYGDGTFKDFPPKKDQHDFHVFGFSWPQTESSLIQQNMLPNGGAWACVEVQNIIVQTVDNVWALSLHPVPPKTMVVKKPSIKRYLLYFIVIIALNMSHFILRRRRRNVDWSATFLWNACQFRIALEQLGITFSHAEDLCNKSQL